MSSRYQFHSRLSNRQRTSLRLRYLGGAVLIASAITFQILLLGNLGDRHLLAVDDNASTVTSYRIDLSHDPGGVFITPPMVRSGTTCQAGSTERCISITVYLNKDAEGLILEQSDGLVASNNTYYVDCIESATLGDPVCLPTHNGKVTITYCAPGTQTCVYKITSVPRLKVQADSTATVGEKIEFKVAGLKPGTVKITSILPGVQGEYDSYLEYLNGQAFFKTSVSMPSQIKWQITGQPFSCSAVERITDTVSVSLYKQLHLNGAVEEYVCAAGGEVIMTAEPVGGKQPYQIKWFDRNNVAIDTGRECMVNVPGVYQVSVKDQSGAELIKSYTVRRAAIPLPQQVQVRGIGHNEAMISWAPVANSSHLIRWRETSESGWEFCRVQDDQPSIKLRSLAAGRTYEVQLMSYANDIRDSSGWSKLYSFSTESPCVQANNLRMKFKNGVAWFYWTPNPYSTRQEIMVKRKNAADWEKKYKLGKSVNSVVIDHLRQDVEYEWVVKSYCPAGDYNGAKEFTLSAVVSTVNDSKSMASADLSLSTTQH